MKCQDCCQEFAIEKLYKYKYFNSVTVYNNWEYDSSTFICEYFIAKLYKNGTAHITYTDFETVDKFNSYVGKFFNYLQS